MCEGTKFVTADDGSAGFVECPRKDICYRHTAWANPHRQSYFLIVPLNLKDGSCEEYVPNFGTGDYE